VKWIVLPDISRRSSRDLSVTNRFSRVQVSRLGAYSSGWVIARTE
jgi:hypothetical protein